MYNNREFECYLETISEEFISVEKSYSREYFITVNKDQHGNFSRVWCNYQPCDGSDDICSFGSHALNHNENWVLMQWKNYLKLIRKQKIKKINEI